MKTDIDTALKDIADWFIKTRREITPSELQPILLKHCEDEKEVARFMKFLETEPGQLRFKTLLRERKELPKPSTLREKKGAVEPLVFEDNVEVYTSEVLPLEVARGRGLHRDPKVEFRYTTYYYGTGLSLFQRDLQRLLRELTDIPYLAVDAYYIPTETGSNPKEPWQMTLEEYAYEEARKYGHGKPRIDRIKAGYGETYRSHKTAVEFALKKGKPVPAEVLKDYPELQRKLPSAVIPTEEEMAKTLSIIDRRPKKDIEESKLRKEFGNEMIDSLRQKGYVTRGSAGPNPPLLVTLRGREAMKAIPKAEATKVAPEAVAKNYDRAADFVDWGLANTTLNTKQLENIWVKAMESAGLVVDKIKMVVTPTKERGSPTSKKVGMPRIDPHATAVNQDKQLIEQIKWLKAHSFKTARDAQEAGY